MRVWVEVPVENKTVTGPYLHAIGDACTRLGAEVAYTDGVVELGDPQHDAFVVAEAPSATGLKRRGARRVAFWAQGIWPEESYMRNHSRLRMLATSHVEKRALEQAERVFLVSDAMRRHYERKYHLSLKTKSMVMACSNEVMHPNSFFVEGKYDRPVFAYAGSLAVHQCIDEMLDSYAKIREAMPEAELMFLTGQVDEARKKLAAHGLPEVEPRYVEPASLTEVLARAKYGFVLRKDNEVNRVATPTKLSTYISNGIIPVYSSCLESFSEVARECTYKIEVKSFDDVVGQVREFENRSIDPNDVRAEYEDLFRGVFDYEAKADDLERFLKGFVS